jgi:RNA-directed DNA polymerase
MVPGTASPDDPDLVSYWTTRRQRSAPPVGGVSLRLLKTQHGRCPLCGGFLLHADREPQTPDEWEQWLKVTRRALRKEAITAQQAQPMTDEPVALHLVHADCRQRHRPNASALP